MSFVRGYRLEEHSSLTRVGNVTGSDKCCVVTSGSQGRKVRVTRMEEEHGGMTHKKRHRKSRERIIDSAVIQHRLDKY